MTPLIIDGFRYTSLAIVIYIITIVVILIYRGYGDTERPVSKGDYQMNTLIQDVAELIPALGYKSCVLVAHDWGGVLAW